MSPNKENALSRLLFAIIKQKNLKDIDWDAVAADPVLLEPIPNGHAARMRFARYRNSVLGHEAGKRRSSGDQHKIQKVKKESVYMRSGMIKSESVGSLPSLAQFSPVSNTSPYLGNEDEAENRFLTPASEHTPNKCHQIDPTLDDGIDPKQFAYTTEFMYIAANDPASLEQSPTTTFEDAINFGEAFADPSSQSQQQYGDPPASQGDMNNYWGNPRHNGSLF